MGDDAELYLDMQEDWFWNQLEEAEEANRISLRNEKWKVLKQLRDDKKISQEDFKKRKDEIFAVEMKRKSEAKKHRDELKLLSQYSNKNEQELKKCIKCGCYHCGSIFTTYEIKEYFDETGICPYCNNKSLLPSSVGGTDECALEDLHSLLYPDEEFFIDM